MIERPIRFYCRECSKELFTLMDYKFIALEPFEEVLAGCICADCILKEIKKDDNNGRTIKRNTKP